MTPRARLSVDLRFPVGAIDRRLFDSFVEHLGRCVYYGIYEPDHPSADENGFREDVLELVRELGVTTIRYPGGNFVSGFKWEDSVGPRDQRPRRPDLAWHSVETNQVGLDEFAGWARKAGAELMYAVNLGTRGIHDAIDMLEYTNLPGGTAFSDARIRNGQMDPDIELVACGSSHSSMPSFGTWEHTVLSHTYEDVDFISCHAYYEEADDPASFVASAVDMDRFIEAVVAEADAVGAARKSAKKINISFDEWNVWYASRYHDVDRITGIDQWPIAPRLLEDSYTVLDAVVVGGLLISLLKHADRVKAASLAQLVNVIAPIMTEPGGPVWRQTTFFPFAITSDLARGAALRGDVVSGTYTSERFGEVDVIDAVITHDDESGASAAFVVNRALESVEFEIALVGLGATRIVSARSLYDDDVHARNTLDDPERVAMRENSTAAFAGDKLTITLPATSWTAIALE